MPSITYDAALANVFWEMLAEKIKNKNCPFCGQSCNEKNFGGVIPYENELRFMHKNIMCLIGLVNYTDGHKLPN